MPSLSKLSTREGVHLWQRKNGGCPTMYGAPPTRLMWRPIDGPSPFQCQRGFGGRAPKFLLRARKGARITFAANDQEEVSTRGSPWQVILASLVDDYRRALRDSSEVESPGRELLQGNRERGRRPRDPRRHLLPKGFSGTGGCRVTNASRKPPLHIPDLSAPWRMFFRRTTGGVT